MKYHSLYRIIIVATQHNRDRFDEIILSKNKTITNTFTLLTHRRLKNKNKVQ